jgi:hypothetical protein
MSLPFLHRWLPVCLIGLVVPASYPQSRAAFPSSEALTYSIEWRLIYAGSARLILRPATSGWSSQIHVESGGMVSKLYKLDDNYSAQLQSAFCTSNTDLEAFEGKKHFSTKVNYDHGSNKASYLERDLIKNTLIRSSEVDIPPCAGDITANLYKLRTLKLEPGQSAQLPMSDGKKSALVRVDAQDREDVQTKAGNFKTIRYESYPFNGVIYKRNARLFIWLTDDARRLPVQIRVRLGFPIGSITLQLDKDEPGGPVQPSN